MKIRIDPQVSILLLAIVLRFTFDPLILVSYLLVAWYSVLSIRNAIIGMFVVWLFTMINPGLVQYSSSAETAKFIVIFSAAFSVFFQCYMRGVIGNKRVVLLTLFVVLVLYIHSLLFSNYPAVSVLKITSWSIVFMSMVVAWGSLGADLYHELQKTLLSLLIALLACSVPLVFVDLGYLRNSVGFQGVLNHPQAFGSVASITAAWVFSKIITERPVFKDLVVLFVAVGLVYLSESRTAGMAFVIGVLVVLFISLFSPRSLNGGVSKATVYKKVLPIFCCVLIAAPVISDYAASFMQKRGESASLVKAYDSSRSGLIQPMLENIASEGYVGIGFGVASTPSKVVIVRDPYFGVPISAPTEKGVMPLAVLEELGVFVGGLIFFWLFFLLGKALAGGVQAFTIVICTITLNLGESTFFSSGGMGLLFIILVSWAVAFKYHDA